MDRWHCDTGASALRKLEELYRGLLAHDGFGDLRVEMRILKRGQKEVILHCGKQYRYVVDFEPAGGNGRKEGAAVTRQRL